MLWEHQIKLAEQGAELLKQLHIVYYNLEMRVGKTLTALHTFELLKKKNVLFITKKKAIKSIINDYQTNNFTFELTVINYEQVSKYKPAYDGIIVDECHSLGAFPKPALRTKNIKKIVGNNDLILLSGTPTPESYSQIFHQFWISQYNPFNEENFYKWAKNYVKVKVKQQKINSFKYNDYTEANEELIKKVVGKYFISYTQKDAGFEGGEISEQCLIVPINDKIYSLVNILLKDRLYTFKDGTTVVCDSAVKLQNKIHQICSGTILTEEKTRKILDTSKAEYIKTNFSNKKIAIYYKFIAEGTAIKQVFPNWTESPETFNSRDDLVFVSQIQSGAMGINLASADALILYNIDFSSLNYWQVRARIQNMKRQTKARVYWLFSEKGIETKIYDAVLKKKDYTLSYFKRDYKITNTYKKVS